MGSIEMLIQGWERFICDLYPQGNSDLLERFINMNVQCSVYNASALLPRKNSVAGD